MWFDKSKAPNQYTQGTVPPLNSHGDITEEDWSTQCKVKPQAPLAPGPLYCLNEDALQHAPSFGHCLAQTQEKVPNQELGCDMQLRSKNQC